MLAPFNSRQSGGSLVPVVLIIAALVISTVVFFTFTRKHLPEAPAAAPTASQTGSAPTAAPQAGTAQPAAAMREPGASVATAPAGSTPAAAATPPVNLGFARPADVGQQLVRSLAAADFSAAGKIAAAADPAQAMAAAGVLEKIIKEMGWQVGPEDKVELLGQVENFTRLSIPLEKPGDPNAKLRLQVDVERDEKMGWKIAKLHLPKELSGALAALPPAAAPAAAMPAAAPATPGAAAGSATTAPAAAAGAPATAAAAAMTKPAAPLFAVAETTDALTFATDFVQALLKHDFTAASRFIDEQKVPPQKLAGLCIVFEEGQYALKPAKPLIITVANPEVSWVIAQVQSETLQQSTEFGLELQRPSTTAEWRVVGLNLSQILGSFAQSAAKLGVPYTPLVKNPRGGESLALYFEYDRAELHPRALKQLEIVAGLLKSDAKRKLSIAGHTDAKGEDSYNIRLSQERAESVKERLVALGVAAEQVITTGLGKAQPLGPNSKADGTDDPEGRSKNRRAEIFLDF